MGLTMIIPEDEDLIDFLSLEWGSFFDNALYTHIVTL